jgi:molybdenum cofactor cytidylyltransferase
MSPLGTRGFEFAAVILAAGGSTRMGRPKLLLPWQGTSIIRHLLGQWENLGAQQIAVVCAAHDEPLHTEVQRLGLPDSNLICNSTPKRGMYGSIQCAALWPGWKSSLSHWVLVLGDQPHLNLSTLDRLIKFARSNPDKFCQPTRAGRGRHPVVLPRRLFLDLVSSSAPNLKEYLSQFEGAKCEIDDQGLDLDIDTPEDYQRAIEMSQS